MSEISSSLQKYSSLGAWDASPWEAQGLRVLSNAVYTKDKYFKEENPPAAVHKKEFPVKRGKNQLGFQNIWFKKMNLFGPISYTHAYVSRKTIATSQLY